MKTESSASNLFININHVTTHNNAFPHRETRVNNMSHKKLTAAETGVSPFEGFPPGPKSMEFEFELVEISLL